MFYIEKIQLVRFATILMTLVENEIQCDVFYASFRHTLKRNHF